MRLRTEAELGTLRGNLKSFSKAREIREGTVAAASRWLEMTEEGRRGLIPDASVPRSFECSFEGCPKHGKGIFVRGGWVYDAWRERWKLTCPVGGETYPSNDFGAFYASEMRERALLTGAHPDDGWGWRAPGAANKHWFIARCCGALWEGYIVPGVLALSRAYVLTGDSSFAEAAAIMLGRIAEVYPEMDYQRQSMYASEFSPSYTGKISNLIHECHLAVQLCEAYDNISAFLARDEVLDRHVRENLVWEVIRGVYGGHIRGNYGSHQLTLLTAALVLGEGGEIRRAVDWVLNNTGEKTPLKEMEFLVDGYIFRDKAAHAEGLNFGIDNLVFREGLGWESSPGYLLHWADCWARIAGLLKGLGVELFRLPKMQRMWRAFAEMRCLDDFVPTIGDCGSVVQNRLEPSNEMARILFEHLQEANAAGLLLRRGLFGGNSFSSYEDLFRPRLERGELEQVARKALRPSKSINMGGFGLAILRSGEGQEETAAALYYGRAATEHGHFDRLNLELFAYGKKVIPDLGYGETAAETREPAAWSKNTACHATVVVDERRQDTQAPGHLRAFVSAPGLQYVDVSAGEAYISASLYRRAVALVSLSPAGHYVLDVFRVAGGQKHDLSTHGFPAAFSSEGIWLSEPQRKGSLPGEEVPFGSYYDDPELDDPFKRRSFYTYRGSGYSYLYDVRRGKPEGPWSATWFDREEKVGLRMTFLPPSSDEVVVANGQPAQKPGNPRALKYILLRNRGRAESTFASVIEPFRGGAAIQGACGVRLVASEGSVAHEVAACKVSHAQGTDFLFQALHLTGAAQFEEGIEFMGELGFLRLDGEGRVAQVSLVGVGWLRRGGASLAISAPVKGRIVAIHYSGHAVEVEWEGDGLALANARALHGETAIISNDSHFTSYTITEARSLEGSGTAGRSRCLLVFGEDEFRIGKFAISGIDPCGSYLTTDTYLYLAEQGYYRGTRLVDAGESLSLRINDVHLSPHCPGRARSASVELASASQLSPFFSADPRSSSNSGHIYDFGPGDQIEIVPHASVIVSPEKCTLFSNCRPKVEGFELNVSEANSGRIPGN